MEAKDEIAQLLFHRNYSELILPEMVRLDKAIEISFTAGVREVVGYFDKPCPHTGGIEEQQLRAMDCPKCWEIQIKEWGIME